MSFLSLTHIIDLIVDCDETITVGIITTPSFLTHLQVYSTMKALILTFGILCCCPLTFGFLSTSSTTREIQGATAIPKQHLPFSPSSLLFADVLHKSSSSSISIDGAAASSQNNSKEDMLTRFNDQITNEFAASHLYLSASIWFESRDWEGMAAYMRGESSDERSHALSLIDFANKRNMGIQLQSFPQPNSNWASPEEVWSDIMTLERDNTQSLLELAQAANACQDFAMLAFLNPFHMEQVDAEAKIGTIIAKVKDEQKTPGLLRQLDHELGQEAAGGA